jgi:hypothetical protein
MDDTVAVRSGAIVAGRFDTFDEANALKTRLVEHGFAADAISVFFNNPPGRHDMTEIGGDEPADPESKHAAGGAMAGAAAGRGAGPRGARDRAVRRRGARGDRRVRRCAGRRGERDRRKRAP